MTAWVIIAWLMLCLCVAVALFRWVARRSSRLTGMPESSPERAFVGGMRVPAMNAAGPLARLEFFDWGVRLHGLRLVRWITPVWEAQYAELTRVEMVSAPLNRGLRFLIDNGPPMIFWTFEGAEIADYLQGRGVPVDRSISRVGWTS